jgi:hypothetical protein
MSTGLKDHFGGDFWGSIKLLISIICEIKKGTKPEQLNAQFPA